MSAVPKSTGGPTSEHYNFERVSFTKALVAFFFFSAERTMSLDEGLFGSALSVPVVSFPSLGSNTVDKTSFQPEASLLPVASPLKISSVPSLSVSFATSSAVHSSSAASSDSVIPSLSGAAQMRPTNANTALPSRVSHQYLRDHLAQRNAELLKLDGKYIQREEFDTFLKARVADINS